MEILQKLKEISTRGRVAFAICCMESSIANFQLKDDKWDSLVLKELWAFCNSSIGLWIYKVAELLPISVLYECDFKIKDYEYFSEKEHNELQELFRNTNQTVLRVLELIYKIGDCNVYIELNSDELKMKAMPFLEELIEIMNYNKIPLPDINLFEQFPITENKGWGREFTRDEVFRSKEN